MNKARPFLRWAGSKKRLLPHLLKHWEKREFSGYIEPFVGSAQLYFSIDVENKVIGDCNDELISLYNTIKESPIEIYTGLSVLENTKENFYDIRQKNPKILNDVDRAIRFIFLNRYCFNGLYRTNLNGDFNVPYGGLKTGSLPTLEDLLQVSERLKSTIIRNDDFEKVVTENLNSNYFVYMDPPYAIENTRIFNQYNPVTFGKIDIERMYNLCTHIDRSESKFLISYAENSEIIDLFGKWNFEKVTTQRFIAGFGKDRKSANEILIFN